MQWSIWLSNPISYACESFNFRTGRMHVNFDVPHSHVTAFGPNLIACDVSSIGSHACVSIEPEHRLHATYRVRTSLACDVPSPNIACMRCTSSDIAGTSLEHRLHAMYESRHRWNIARTSLVFDVRVRTSLTSDVTVQTSIKHRSHATYSFWHRWQAMYRFRTSMSRDVCPTRSHACAPNAP